MLTNEQKKLKSARADIAYRWMVDHGQIDEGSPEQIAAEDAALLAKWVTHPSGDPLWQDLARVASRMLQAEIHQIGLELCAYFIRSLPARLRWRIAMAWCDSDAPHQSFIANGALQEWKTSAAGRRIFKGGEIQPARAGIGDGVSFKLGRPGDWAEKPPTP